MESPTQKILDELVSENAKRGKVNQVVADGTKFAEAIVKYCPDCEASIKALEKLKEVVKFATLAIEGPRS